MDPKRPREEDEPVPARPREAAPRHEIDENERANELENVEEVVGPQPGGGEESGHS